LNRFEEKIDLWDYLTKTTKTVVMYGMGNGADKILTVCAERGIEISDFFASDGSVRGHSFHGKRVLFYSEIKEKYGAENIIVLLSFASSLPDVLDTFRRVAAECELYAPDVPVCGGEIFDIAYARKNAESIRRAYGLLEDEESPGEIDDSEAKWLRAKIQTKGYQDSVDILLLENLRKKSINYPEILNFKGKMARRFESLLFYSRYLSIFAVIGSLLSACALFVRGSEVVIRGLVDFFKTNGFKYHGEYEKLIEAFVSSVDIYLFAMVLIIFGMGVYELFINKIDPVEKKVDSRPSWLQISSIDELKSSLGKVILMVLIVSFFKHSLDIEYHSATDLLLLAAGIVLLAGALFIANYHPNDKK
jgi:uncharacterized membrane protein YqhA